MPEVILNLDDKRWYVTRNMLYLMRLTGRKEHSEKAVPYVRHKDDRVVFEALGALLALGHKQAVPYLRSILNRSEPKKRDIGVRLAGAYKVRAVRKELTEILERKDAIGDEDLFKPSVIKALGQIGDVQAVPSIAKTLGAKKLLKRGPSLEIRKAVYESLGGYPFDTVRQIVEDGLKSDSDEIKAICARLLRGHRGGEG
jgi:HEAT repeat protein